MAQDYRARVTATQSCGDDVLILTLGMPDGYSFRAGQWLRVTLPTTEGTQTRTLSIASAPADGEIVLATRLSDSAFKRALAGVASGDEITIGPPGGRLRLPEEALEFGFLVGGVGMTPVRSLLREARRQGRSLDGSVVLYGNRDETCILWRGEIEGLQEIGLRVTHVLEEPPSGWTGESGLIHEDMVKRLAPPTGRTYVVAGPPAMVDAMVEILDRLAVPEELRMVEAFGPRG